MLIFAFESKRELIMLLSDLQTGERGVIVKVLGHGGFRKRIIEMGFVKGKLVEVLLNAPLQGNAGQHILRAEIGGRDADQQRTVRIGHFPCKAAHAVCHDRFRL